MRYNGQEGRVGRFGFGALERIVFGERFGSGVFGRELLVGSFGQGVFGSGFWAGSFGPGALGRELWAGSFGPGALGVEFWGGPRFVYTHRGFHIVGAFPHCRPPWRGVRKTQHVLVRPDRSMSIELNAGDTGVSATTDAALGPGLLVGSFGSEALGRELWAGIFGSGALGRELWAGGFGLGVFFLRGPGFFSPTVVVVVPAVVVVVLESRIQEKCKLLLLSLLSVSCRFSVNG